MTGSRTTRSSPRQSLGERVYETLRESIVTLKYQPGQMLYENELSETLQVSRTPIREAIRLLAGEQLLDVLPQRGTRVAYISERKVKETRFIRTQLEVGAFRLAAALWDSSGHSATRRALALSLEEQREAAQLRDVAAFLRADEDFHRLIMEMTGNETLLSVVNHMRGHLNRLRCLVLAKLQPMEAIIREHEELLDSIERNDEAGTVRLLESHLGKLDREIPLLRKTYPSYFID